MTVGGGYRTLKQPSSYLYLALVAGLLLLLTWVKTAPETHSQDQNWGKGEIIYNKLSPEDKESLRRHNQQILPQLYLGDARPDIVVYNRVPKCASTTTRAVMATVAQTNGMRVLSSKVYDREYLNTSLQVV